MASMYFSVRSAAICTFSEHIESLFFIGYAKIRELSERILIIGLIFWVDGWLICSWVALATSPIAELWKVMWFLENLHSIQIISDWPAFMKCLVHTSPSGRELFEVLSAA
jgi:hypothetical protein